jgi:hypothetical protein
MTRLQDTLQLAFHDMRQDLNDSILDAIGSWTIRRPFQPNPWLQVDDSVWQRVGQLVTESAIG